jgi:hypothetical protein
MAENAAPAPLGDKPVPAQETDSPLFTSKGYIWLFTVGMIVALIMTGVFAVMLAR